MKTFKEFTICRNGSNRPATVRATTETDFTFIFNVNSGLSDKHILSLVGRLVDHEQRGDGKKAKQ